MMLPQLHQRDEQDDASRGNDQSRTKEVQQALMFDVQQIAQFQPAGVSHSALAGYAWSRKIATTISSHSFSSGADDTDLERPPGQSFEALKSAFFCQSPRLGSPLFDPGALRQFAQNSPQLLGRRASQLGERFDA